MSTALNRLRYDSCAYASALTQSVAPIDYILNPIKYRHCGECRVELGVVGGTAVSHVDGNLVDLENELMNIRRPATQCSAYQHAPTLPGRPIDTPIDDVHLRHGRRPNAPVSTQMLHLRPCQMVSYPSVPNPPLADPYVCPAAQSVAPPASRHAPAAGR